MGISGALGVYRLGVTADKCSFGHSRWCCESTVEG